MKNSISLFVFILFSAFAFGQQPERFTEEGSEKKENQPNVSAPEKVPEHEESTSSERQASRRQTGNGSGLDRWRFGGNLGLGFGTFTYVNLAPRVHYLVKPNLGLGGGVSWYYWKDNREVPPNFYNYKSSGSTWGFSLFSWVTPLSEIADVGLLRQLTLQAEYEPLNYEVSQGYYLYQNGDREYVYERDWVHTMLLGGGLRQQTGRANVFIMVLYDVLYDMNRSFYGSPWVIRIGAGF